MPLKWWVARYVDEEELRGRLTKNSRGILDDYQRYRAEQRGKHVASVSGTSLPLSS